MYVCRKCKEEIKALSGKSVRCTKCGSRILYKKRKPVAKTITTD
ncbi:MAG: hypothetical protein QXW70_01050 [Candidatus Anstonellales archaeon]